MKLDTHRQSLYPSQWTRLVHKVTDEGKTVRVPCSSLRHAQRLRLKFYTFRRSLHTSQSPDAISADGVMAQLEGTMVVFSARDLNEEAQTLEKALEEAK